MKYSGIISETSEKICSDISFSDSVADYVIPCSINFYCYDDEKEDIDIYGSKSREPIGSISGYLILCRVMDQLLEDAYTVCDDHSADLEAVMSILTDHNRIYAEEDVFYITHTTLQGEEFNTIMNRMPYTILTHYHVYPNVICYYPAPLFETETPPEYKAKEEIGKLIARDIIEQSMPDPDTNEKISPDESGYIEGIDDTDIEDEYKPAKISLHLDEEQLNAYLGRRNDYNTYPENAKNLKEFEKYEQAGFKEFRNSRLLVRHF